jgi:3-oxoacyl-[acyl-carrier protein] reductase
MEFSGKTVLVTGGASGIGRAVSLAFGRAGANVVLSYVTSAGEAAEVTDAIGAAGGHALSRSADLTDAVAVDALFAAARDRFGQVDVLVANAGGLLKRSRCVDTDPDFWEQAIALNLTSAFLCCRAALTEMEPRGSGAIVLMSSLAAFDGGGPGASHYAAAKGALVSYTRALAKEVGPLGIRVNGVAPGLIGTRFHDVFNTPEGRRTTVERTPLRREGTPDDVAETILFLASPRASFLTGETIQINGGLGMF